MQVMKVRVNQGQRSAWSGGLGLLMAGLCAACAPTYVAPNLSESSKLRFRTDTGARTILSRVDVSACPSVPTKEVVAITAEDLFNQGEISKVEMIGGSGASETKIRERLILADKPFVYEIRTPAVMTDGAWVYPCSLSGVFVPRRDVQYELEYAVGNKGCRSRLFRLSQGAAGEVVRGRELSHRQIKVFNDADYCQWRAGQTAQKVPEGLLPDVEGGDPSNPATPSPQAPPQATTPPQTQAAIPANERIGRDPPGQPRTGDRWVYAFSSQARSLGTVSIEIVDSTQTRVKERVTREGYATFAMEREIDWPFMPRQFQEIVTLPGGYLLAEIAPYFPPQTTLEIGTAWKNVAGKFFLPHAGAQTFVMDARVTGQETVRVPAGEFQAWRIEAQSQPDPGRPTRVKCTFWYSSTFSRTVKMNLKVDSPYLAARSDDTYALVSYQAAP
jgi:hypothetical protein